MGKVTYIPVEDGEHTMGPDFAPLHISHNNDAEANTWIEYGGDNVMLASGMVVCRAHPAPPQGELPAPDGPGDWWFEGHYILNDGSDGEDYRDYYKITVNSEGKLSIDFDILGVDYFTVDNMVGTWWPATTPWQAQPRPALDAQESVG